MPFPTIIPNKNNGQIPLPMDIGLHNLLEQVYEHINLGFTYDSKISQESVQQFISDWFLGLENDPQIIVERQELIKYALDNPDFLQVIDNLLLPVGLNENNSYCEIEEFGHYHSKMQRFEVLAKDLPILSEVLNGREKPQTLETLLDSCQNLSASVNEIKSQLNPEIELSVSIAGNVQSGFLSGFFFNCFLDDSLNGTYVLKNLTTEAIKEEKEITKLGGPTDYYGNDTFLRYLKARVKKIFKLNLGLNMTILNSTYSLKGSVKYSPKVNHDLFNLDQLSYDFLYSDDQNNVHGSFSKSEKIKFGNEIKHLIDLAKYNYNNYLIGRFDQEIKDFEKLLVELKGLSAMTHFLQGLKKKDYPLVFPQIIEKDSMEDIAIKNLYHPLLVSLAVEQEIIPNEIYTSKEKNVILITGANNNGKTCYMDSLGLSQVMFQAGMPIVAEEARMKLRDKLLTHYIHPGDLKASQSRFAYECYRVQELFKNLSENSLLLCDELFTGTAPQDGEVVSKMVLESLLKSGVTVFFTTHYHNLGKVFEKSPYLMQLCCQLDHSNDPPTYTYKVIPGISSDSDGLVIASQYGVNENNLDLLLSQKARQEDLKLR